MDETDRNCHTETNSGRDRHCLTDTIRQKQTLPDREGHDQTGTEERRHQTETLSDQDRHFQTDTVRQRQTLAVRQRHFQADTDTVRQIISDTATISWSLSLTLSV